MAKFETMALDESYKIQCEGVEGDIWNQVCQSELFGEEMEQFLKQVTYGQRSYTTIDAYQQIKKATEIFGPFGVGWGISHIDKIAEIPVQKKTNDGVVTGTQLFLKVVMFYVWNGHGEGVETHTVPLVQDIFVDASGDSGKKMITDCITKFLSYLGFNFDVFQGRFDGNKMTGAKAKEEQVVQLKALANSLLSPEKADSVIDYHKRREWRKADVEKDIEKLQALEKKRKEATS